MTTTSSEPKRWGIAAIVTPHAKIVRTGFLSKDEAVAEYARWKAEGGQPDIQVGDVLPNMEVLVGFALFEYDPHAGGKGGLAIAPANGKPEEGPFRATVAGKTSLEILGEAFGRDSE